MILWMRGKIAEDFWNKYVVNVYDHYPFLRSRRTWKMRKICISIILTRKVILPLFIWKNRISINIIVLFCFMWTFRWAGMEWRALQSVCLNGKKLDIPFIIGYYTQKDRFLSLTPFTIEVYRGYDNNEDSHSFYSRLKKRNNVLYILSKILYGYKKIYGIEH